MSDQGPDGADLANQKISSVMLQSSPMSNQSANAVIIGGGVIGASAAYSLAKRGMKNVTLIERESALGAGSTSKAAGGVRMQFSTEINIQLSIESIKKYETFAKDMEYETTFFQNGYLFLLKDPGDVKHFQTNLALQQRLGVPVEWISPQQAQKILPQLFIDDLQGATFCPKDGFISTGDITAGYERQCRKLGVNILMNTPVTNVLHGGGQVKGVTTSHGDIHAPIVINCTGAWAKLIGQMIGLTIPIEPIRRHAVVTRPFPQIKDPFPLTVDFATRLYFHRESGGILLGRSNLAEQPGFDTSVDGNYLPEIIEAALHRVPCLADTDIAHSWAGLYEVTPDAHPIVGETPSLKGLFHAAGFSGHGFMHAPAIGELLAELIMTGKTHMDLTPLSLTRFQKGAPTEEYAVI